MPLLTILRYPDDRLHRVAQPVTVVNDEIRQLVRNMTETMYAAPGVGLAATQVDVHKQIIIVDISETRDQLKVLINPRILQSRGKSELEEGCLSVPGVFERVTRAQWVQVSALDIHGTPFELEAQDMLSVCIQHEMDHLKGRVFVEYLSPLKRNLILRKLKKRQRQTV
jgi:peptide deformylase